MKNPLLFPKEELPRTPRLIRMHPVDAGYDVCGGYEPGRHSVKFQCPKCKFVPGWAEVTISEARKGIPCPKCNEGE